MKLNGNSLDEVLKKETLSDEDIVFLLGLTDPEDCTKLQQAAYEKTTELMGNKVYYRGLIEVSNVCTVDCRYCGIRKDNHVVSRYTLTKKEILSAALFAAENGYGSICLQAGERNDPKFVSFISDCLREIHRKTVSESLPDGLGITLSLGDQTKEVYEEWAEASGNRKNLRYLARFESSNHELFDFLHNVPHKKSKQLEHRLQCLQWLKECGYQVGTGVMIGIPGQTLKDLCSDIRLFQKLEADMIGMGPYLMSLVMGNINIAAATAMQVLDPQGRETAISYGANVVMPNLTPLQYREGYQLYDKKPGLKDDPETFGLKLEGRIQSKGREVGWNLSGSSRKWLNRTGNSQEGYDGKKSAGEQSVVWIKSTAS